MAATEVRGTQSFVYTLTSCWRRPSLTGLEIAWRWLFGIPATTVVVWQVRKALLAATDGTLDPGRLGLDPTLLHDPVGALSADPMGASEKFSRAIRLVSPGLDHVAVWMLPLLVVVGIVVSSFGRTLVLRRADPAMRARPVTLMALQTLRVAALVGVFALWFRLVAWCGNVAVDGPITRHADPNLVLYCAMLIVLTLGLFTLWAILSWVFSVAPLLAMLRNLGTLASLTEALRLGPLKGKLVEINLVMGIVKIMLLVLAMTFSACPLPFQDVTTPEFLAWWWAGVSVLYVVWSDFFHVARLVAYLNLWRAYESQATTTDRRG
jgi:hypothetical protein